MVGLFPIIIVMTTVALLFAILAPQDLPLKKQKPKPAVTVVAVRPEKTELKEGETDRLAFDLDIPGPYHLYSVYLKQKVGKPPVFSFEGAEIAGRIEEPPPKHHREPLGPNDVLEYDYHEGRITIVVPMRLKSPAAAGALELKGKIVYQICDESQCFDNQTSFSVPLKVLEGGTSPPPAVRVLAAKADRARLIPGEAFALLVDLEIPEKYHIYPASLPSTRTKGTNIRVEGVEVAGPVEEPAPKRRPAPGGAKDAPELAIHEGKITFRIPVRVPSGTPVGALEIRGKIEYQICDEKLCTDNTADFQVGVEVQEGKSAGRAGSKDAAQRAAQKELATHGVAGFILVAMLGGLVSLVMPCVYPLIPITLTYFIKQGAGSRAKGAVLSSAYSAGIILVFTGVGFLFSILLGEDGARKFASNPWVNSGVAALFLWFAFSLFGLYDIALPSWITGSLTGQRRGGAGGAFILGALFSVVTFTCTIPIAANILAVSASEGAGLKFIGLLSMLAYSGTMAAPFFVLGLFPSLLKEVPKSGGWLHTVKVTAAFAELALALTYLAKADLVWNLGFLTRTTMIAIWVAVLGFMGLYLLGVFRLRGDEEGAPPSVGLGRMLVALAFAVLAAIMGSGFSGTSLGALEILVVVPPEPSASGAGGVSAASTLFDSLPPAEAESQRTGKPLFIEFTGKT
jgi:thiol:disulfide interchange protein DsbD